MAAQPEFIDDSYLNPTFILEAVSELRTATEEQRLRSRSTLLQHMLHGAELNNDEASKFNGKLAAIAEGIGSSVVSKALIRHGDHAAVQTLELALDATDDATDRVEIIRLERAAALLLYEADGNDLQ